MQMAQLQAFKAEVTEPGNSTGCFSETGEMSRVTPI